VADRNEILTCLRQLSLAFPKEASHYAEQDTIELWVELLSDLPDGITLAATRQCIAALAWFPKISEIRQAAIDILEAASPFPDPHAAWSNVQAELGRVGHFAGLPGYEAHFSHPLIEQAVHRVGWKHLCFSENHISDRAQFLQAYQELVDGERRKSQRLPATRQLIAALRQAQKTLPSGEK
jgi:hypothetical protein